VKGTSFIDLCESMTRLHALLISCGIFFKWNYIDRRGFHPPATHPERYSPGRVQLKFQRLINRPYLNRGRQSGGVEPRERDEILEQPKMYKID